MQNLILLVEDDPTLRLLGTKQFHCLGLNSEVACNGAEAVEKANNGYALIFMDLSLPEMNGIEATLRIRENEQRNGQKRTPIVAMTAYSERERALAVGMDDYIQKPVLIEPLRQLLLKWAPELISDR